MTAQLAMDKLLVQRKQIEEKEPGFGKKNVHMAHKFLKAEESLTQNNMLSPRLIVPLPYKVGKSEAQI